jgi:hypothetical protein
VRVAQERDQPQRQPMRRGGAVPEPSLSVGRSILCRDFERFEPQRGPELFVRGL